MARKPESSSRHPSGAQEHLSFELSQEQRAQVLAALPLGAPGLGILLEECWRAWAIEQIEDALGHVTGQGEKLRRMPPAVRKELEHVVLAGEELQAAHAGLSADARRLLEESQPVLWITEPFAPGAERLSEGIVISAWAREALKRFDAQPEREKPGRPYRWDLRQAAEELADLWLLYTGRGLGRRQDRANPVAEGAEGFAAFLRAAIGAVEPGFDGVRLAREIEEVRRR